MDRADGVAQRFQVIRTASGSTTGADGTESPGFSAALRRSRDTLATVTARR